MHRDSLARMSVSVLNDEMKEERWRLTRFMRSVVVVSDFFLVVEVLLGVEERVVVLRLVLDGGGGLGSERRGGEMLVGIAVLVADGVVVICELGLGNGLDLGALGGDVFGSVFVTTLRR